MPLSIENNSLLHSLPFFIPLKLLGLDFVKYLAISASHYVSLVGAAKRKVWEIYLDFILHHRSCAQLAQVTSLASKRFVGVEKVQYGRKRDVELWK
jgi:hypothetical protein